MHCSKCGHDNPSGKKFCVQCGTALSPAAPVVTPPSPPPALSDPAIDGSIQSSLGSLGIQVSRQQIVGVAVAVLAGWLVGRALAFDFVLSIYAYTMGAIQNLLNLQTSTRDTLNIYAMIALPFLTSFVIAWLFSRARKS